MNERDICKPTTKVHRYWDSDGEHFFYYCPVCHTLLKEEDNFCSACGQRVKELEDE